MYSRPNTRSLSARTLNPLNVLFLACLILLLATSSRAQTCPIHGTGGNTIGASVSKVGTAQALPQGAIVATGGSVQIDSTVTTFGGCEAACTFYPNLVNHIKVWVDASTEGSLNGTYDVGNVFGKTQMVVPLSCKA